MNNDKKTKWKDSLFKLAIAFMVVIFTEIIILKITGKSVFELIFWAMVGIPKVK